MANYTYTSAQQEIFHTFNEFDRHGLLLDLVRLSGEKNKTYKRRLLDVHVKRASSAYLGLIYGITRELGFSITKALTITPVSGHSMANPATVFQDTKCYLYSDYDNGTLVSTIDRYSKSSGAYIISELISTINATGQFTAVANSNTDSMARSMGIYNQSSIMLVPFEELARGTSKIKLDNSNLIEGSVILSSSNLTIRKTSSSEISKSNEYYVDHENGVIYTQTAPEAGASVRYMYRKDSLQAMHSPVIIHDLQSADFQTHMFYSDDTSSNGLPTPLGGDIINELMSVHAGGWGE